MISAVSPMKTAGSLCSDHLGSCLQTHPFGHASRAQGAGASKAGGSHMSCLGSWGPWVSLLEKPG